MPQISSIFHEFIFSLQYFHTPRIAVHCRAGLKSVAANLWNQTPYTNSCHSLSSAFSHPWSCTITACCSRSSTAEHVARTACEWGCTSDNRLQLLTWHLADSVLATGAPAYILPTHLIQGFLQTKELCTAHPRSSYPPRAVQVRQGAISIPACKDLSLPVPGVLTDGSWSPHKAGQQVTGSGHLRNFWVGRKGMRYVIKVEVRWVSVEKSQIISVQNCRGQRPNMHITQRQRQEDIWELPLPLLLIPETPGSAQVVSMAQSWSWAFAWNLRQSPEVNSRTMLRLEVSGENTWWQSVRT